MLHYDLTATRLFDCVSRDQLPTEAELFVVTVALLLVRDLAYSEFARCEVVFLTEDLGAVADCLEYRLAPLAPDIGDGDSLRQRLSDFVGLRMEASSKIRRQARRRPAGPSYQAGGQEP